MNSFDVIIVTTFNDYMRTRANLPRLVKNLPGNKIIFVGSKEIGLKLAEGPISDRISFIDENEILPFDDVKKVICQILGREDVPRGVVGWYYQQFLKMQYSKISEHDFYMSWDGDTVPCKPFSMFDENTCKPFFDVKTEHHEEYFITLSRLFPAMKKIIGKSFISEHMLFNKAIMSEMITKIENIDNLQGTKFYEKILWAIRPGYLESNSFSEFESYGTYVAFLHSDEYRIRQWHSIRYGSMYLISDAMTDADYEWIGRDFDAVSYEKNQDYVPEIGRFFSDTSTRDKLSARMIVETIQECSSEGMEEKWE